MSQIIYRYENKEVVAGWDVPLQHIFLNVFDLDPQEDEDGYSDEVIYFSDYVHPEGMFPEEVVETLIKMEIPVPEDLEGLLRRHREINAGNVVVHLRLE
jgi:hypothetical protein